MHGVLNLNKPQGITSRHAVSKAQKALGVRKAGHAGTLDPMATGVLLICIGEATKISRFLMDSDKSYRATLKLGERTDTQDAEGRVIETRVYDHVTPEFLKSAFESFSGRIEQMPPMYSAVKINGQPLHRLARKGIEAERKARDVEIRSIVIVETAFPYVTFDVVCSKGTYIRTLSEDIGLRLGCGAHLTALERTRSGVFSVEKSIALDEVDPEKVGLVTIAEALTQCERITIGRDAEDHLRHGRPVALSDATEGEDRHDLVVWSEDGRVVGIGDLSAGVLRISRILNLPF